MENFDKIAATIGLTMLAIAAAIFIVRLVRLRSGAEGAKKRVYKLLCSYASPRGYKVIDRPVLVHDGLTGWADHLVVGYFGVLLVYDLHFMGEFYGKADDKKWSITREGKRYEIDNPGIHAAQCTGRVRTLLRDAGIRVPVEFVTVLTAPAKQTMSYVKSDAVVSFGRLRKYLSKTRFEEDHGTEIERTAALLEAALKKDV